MDVTRAQVLGCTARGSPGADELSALSARLWALTGAAAGQEIACEVSGLAADAATVDALARLQLAAVRCGCTIRLRHPSAQLLDLVALMGLADVLFE